MCFLIKKMFDDNKKSYLYDGFFVLNRNFTTEHDKIVKHSRFFQIFFQNFSNSRFFSLSYDSRFFANPVII